MTLLPVEDPNTAQIEELLRSIRPIPGCEFHRRMALAPWKTASQSSKGRFEMNGKSRFAALVAVAVVLVAALMLTPAGKVFASQILHFFARTPGRTVPLPPEQVVPPLPTITPEPTHALALQPVGAALRSTPTSALTPAYHPQEPEDLSLVEAEAVVGFDLYEPLRLPRDYRLTRIAYHPDLQAVSLQYASPQAGSGEFFQITEGKKMEPLSVGPNALVETVAVGEYRAEFVRGGWFVADGASEESWEGDAGIYTLRWQAEEVAISIEFFLNDSFSPAYLDRDEMLAVGASLSRCAAGSDAACEISQAAAAVGFTPWQFATTPADLSFGRVDYRHGLTGLWYTSATGGVTLMQSIQDFAALEDEPWSRVPSDVIQSVIVSGQSAEYVRGSFRAQPGKSEAIWNEDAPLARLRWKNGDWWFQIVKIGETGLEPDLLAALAEQMVNDTAQAPVPATPQPSAGWPEYDEAFSTIADLEARIGMDVEEPGLVPEGLAFSHARYMPLSRGVMLFYGDFEPDKYHSNGPVLIVSQAPRTVIDSIPTDIYPPEALQAVEVNGYPGQFITGMLEIGAAEAGQPTPTPVWTPDTGVLILTWWTDDMVYSINFNPSRLGARVTQQDLLDIADSMHP